MGARCRRSRTPLRRVGAQPGHDVGGHLIKVVRRHLRTACLREQGEGQQALAHSQTVSAPLELVKAERR